MMDCRPLFAPLEQALVELLYSLEDQEWNLPTVAAQWSVRDVAAHLLDTSLRNTARVRDGHRTAPESPIRNNEDLVRFINTMNADFVKLMRRFSTRQICEFTSLAATPFVACMENEPLDSPSPFGVSWAGEESSLNWFHIAREYTERWHHQQQIREATGKPGILNQEFGRPALEIFLRALPFTYHTITAALGTTIWIDITGEAACECWLIKAERGWELNTSAAGKPVTEIHLPDTTAWKLLTKSWREAEAGGSTVVIGDADLARPFFSIVAVVA